MYLKRLNSLSYKQLETKRDTLLDKVLSEMVFIIVLQTWGICSLL